MKQLVASLERTDTTLMLIGRILEPREGTMEFPESTTFWDVEGIPVTLNAGEGVPYSAAWDTVPPRKFPPDSVRRNGAEISRTAFDKLVASCRGTTPANPD